MFELREQEEGKVEETPAAPPKYLVTREMLDLFCGSYEALAGEMPDPSAVRSSLELVLQLQANRERGPEDSGELRKGFIVYGDAFTGKIELGSYAELDDAIAASQGKGFRGTQGDIMSFAMVWATPTGALERRKRLLVGSRMTPPGTTSVGFMDLREFEYGTRNGARGPVRSYFGGNSFAVPAGEPVNGTEPHLVRELLLQFSSLVGVWRFADDSEGWRGEFRGSTDEELDRWLPRRRYTDEHN